MHKHNHTPDQLSAIGHSETTARLTAKRFLAKTLPTLVASLFPLTALTITAPQAKAAEPPVITTQPVGDTLALNASYTATATNAYGSVAQTTSPNALPNAQTVASTLADGYTRQFAGEVVVHNNKFFTKKGLF